MTSVSDWWLTQSSNIKNDSSLKMLQHGANLCGFVSMQNIQSDTDTASGFSLCNRFKNAFC